MAVITTELTKKIAVAVAQARYIPMYLREDAESYVTLAILDGIAKGKDFETITSGIAIKRRIVDFSRQERSISSGHMTRKKDKAREEEAQWQRYSTTYDKQSVTRHTVVSHAAPDNEFSSSELSGDMGHAIQAMLQDGRLQPDDIELLSLRYRDDLTLREIGDKLGVRLQKVAKRLDAIQAMLKESVEFQYLVSN